MAAVDRRAAFPEFAAFVADARAIFGDDVQATLRTKPQHRWVRCEWCRAVFTIPGHPEDMKGILGVSCGCGRVAGLGGVRWIGRPVPVVVTPGLTAMGDSHSDRSPNNAD